MKRLNFFAGGFGQLNLLCRIYRNDLMKNKKKKTTPQRHMEALLTRESQTFL